MKMNMEHSALSLANSIIILGFKNKAHIQKMTKTYILYEHALGYAIFRVKVKTVEGLKNLTEQLLDDSDGFISNFKLHAFVPFTSSACALQNCNGISEGIMSQELKEFLEDKLSSTGDILLCVADRKLAESIKAPEAGLPGNITCSSESVLHEVYRALRLYFPKYIGDLSHFDESKAQIGLGHSYSRAKVKFNIYRNDNMIIQSINLLDQLDKDVNNFCMRVKEWFSYHFPELSKIVPDNATFVKVVSLIKTRTGANEENLQALESIVNSEIATSIIEAAKLSVGFDITDEDAENLGFFTEKIMALIERRKLTQEYLAKKLVGVAPNLNALIGDRVCARLIAHAGSLQNLAKFPASTIQILGAEKALFRALRSRGSTPKYGLIYHSPFITRAAKENKGRISRFLAAKCAIASRIDCFSEILCDIYGKHLKKQIEDKLNYFETGAVPPTNAEAMACAIAEVNKYIRKMKKKAIKILNKRDSDNQAEDVSEMITTEVKKKKKKKQQLVEENESVENHVSFQLDEPVVNGFELEVKKKKKKKRHNSESAKEDTSIDVESIEEVKKARKRTASESSVALDNSIDNGISAKKKKKKIA